MCELSTDQEMLDRVAKIAHECGLLGVSPRLRYWRIKNDKYAIGWTTEKDGKGKFYAFIYRITKDKWKRTKKVAFGRRKKAKERAYKWYCQRKEKLAQT